MHFQQSKTRDVRFLRQRNCKFCARDLQILRAIFANSAQIVRNISTRFFYGTIVYDTGVLSRVSWLVGPLKLRVAIQLTLSLRLLKMHCDQRLHASIGLQNTDVSRCQCCRYSRALCGGSKLVGRESRDAGLCVDFNQHVACRCCPRLHHTRALRHIFNRCK